MAERPSSRGGIGVPRPASRSGAPPGTAMRAGMRPGTGQRANLQSRMGTAARQGPINTSGIGMNASMNILDRPTTQQGLAGGRPGTGAQGPARQVQDHSYYLQLLHAKQADITKEIAKLKENMEKTAQDNAAYSTLEKKYEQLTNDMRALQGKLADYNLLLDRQRVNKEARDIAQECNQLKQANAAETQRVDDVFNHRVHLEGQARSIEEQLHEHHQMMEKRLLSVDDATRTAFINVQNEHRRLTIDDIPRKNAELHHFSERVNEMEAAVMNDPQRQQVQRIKDDIRKLEKAHAELTQELDGPTLSVTEQREMLLAKVKSDNAEIAEAEKQLAEMQDGLRKGRAKLAQLKADAGAANDPKAQKQQELFARDKEMSELIDTFEEKKAIELKKTTDTQSEIVRLLQAMSRKQEYLDNSAGLSAARMQEMKSDLDFKQTQMDNSATTSNRLGLELEKRKVELEKIHTLDQKISSELTQLTEKMESMKAELATFQETGKLKAEASQKMAELKAKSEKAREATSKDRQRALALKKQYDELHETLRADQTAQSLDELEGKMRMYEQTIFQLSEFIATKGSETMYESVQHDCLKVMAGINQETITVLAEAPTWVPQNPNGAF